jgi:hypothetical protein
MSNIQRILGITTEDFWKASKTLHNMEVLDMFENEVVKISDQILSTYLFQPLLLGEGFLVRYLLSYQDTDGCEFQIQLVGSFLFLRLKMEL